MSTVSPPRLRAIRARSYRCFENEARLELAPLTLVYGRNNAGKSALLRLVKIIADSCVDGASSPFELGTVGGSDITFLDAVSKLQGHKRLGVILEWSHPDAGVFIDEYELRFSDEESRVIVDSLKIAKDDTTVFELAARPTKSGYVYYMSRSGVDDTPLGVSFAGLVPKPTDHQPLTPELTELFGRLTSLRGQVQWLSSVRATPPRIIPRKGRTIRALSPDGEEAYELLLSDTSVQRSVSSFYERPQIHRSVRIEEKAPPYHQILLNPTEGSLKDVLLADTGEGMQHVFPVLVAAARAAAVAGENSAALKSGAGPRAVLAVEEPESHLHADAQQALALHLAEIAAGEAPPVILAETHSRVLLLGIQLAVAKNVIPSDRVIVYWVDQEDDGRSMAIKVDVDPGGRLGNSWPRSVLSEDRELARKLLRMQQRPNNRGES